VLLSNVSAAVGNRHTLLECWNSRERKEVQLSHTCIEVNKEVHTFVVDDQDHPQMIEIHAEVRRLSGLKHDARYVPYTKFVLCDVEAEEIFFSVLSP
jgi:hypothetical protein